MTNQPSIAAEFAAAIEARLHSLEQARAAQGSAPAAPAPTDTSPADTPPAASPGEAVAAPPANGVGVAALEADAPSATAAAPAPTRAAPVTPRPSEEAVQERLREAEELAALSGLVDPRKLFGPDVDEPTRQDVLSRLASGCTIQPFKVTPDTSESWWLLLKDRRVAVLRRLRDQELLSGRLAGPLPPTDRFGELLRELLRHGAETRLEGRSREELLALEAAIEATDGLRISTPDREALRRLTRSAEPLKEYATLVPAGDGFVGRDEELARLHAFVQRGKVVERPGRRWEGLVLTGLGGAGKSTLLAKFAQEVADAQAATVAILDFDRPGISADDLYWLDVELARQVAYQYPETAETLREVRRDARDQRSRIADQLKQANASAESAYRSLSQVLYGVRTALEKAGLDRRTFLLVLDTFEEVAQRNLMHRVFDWLDAIQTWLSQTPIQVIFSGRLYTDALDVLGTVCAEAPVEVKDLPPEQAEELLLKLKVPATAARRLAYSDVLPRRPLELKLLAQVVQDSDLDVDALEADLRAGGEAASALFAGLVYRRVLRRIPDPTLRALAIPGLVLRYVTPELIQQVLVPALDLPYLTDAQAIQATDDLASYGWLAYRGEHGEVWHTRELRRSMLKAMIAREPQRAQRVNEVAAAYFGRADTDPRRNEALYHRLMLLREPESTSEIVERDDLRRVSTYLGADVVDLPPPAATLLRWATGQDLSIADLRVLPVSYRWSAGHDIGERLIQSREYGQALEVVAIVRGAERRPSTAPDGRRSWEIETLYATASWQELDDPRARRGGEGGTPVDDLATRLFPWEIVGRGRDLGTAGVRFLTSLTGNPPTWSGIVESTTVQRVATGLILAAHRASSDEIAEVARRLGEIEGGGASPLTEWRLFQLGLLAPEPVRSDLHHVPSTLKLDAGWLERLAELYSTRSDYVEAGATRMALEALQPTTTGAPFTSRTLLAQFDRLDGTPDWRSGLSLAKHWAEWDAETLASLLRGPDPELRDPARFALLDAYRTPADRRALARLIADVVALPVTDLAPDVFVEALAVSAEHGLVPYVELVDRAWKLGELLERAQRIRPQSSKLRAVRRAWERWDAAVRDLIPRVRELVQRRAQ